MNHRRDSQWPRGTATVTAKPAPKETERTIDDGVFVPDEAPLEDALEEHQVVPFDEEEAPRETAVARGVDTEETAQHQHPGH